MKKEIIIYQAKSGKIEFRGDFKKNTVWGTQQQIAELFNISQPVVSRHIKNIFKDREIDKKSNMQFLHIAFSDKPVTFYSLDMILSVGYRTNSKLAIKFRKWATKTLKQHLLEGYTINKKLLIKNYRQFQKTMEDIKHLLPENKSTSVHSAVELIGAFADTWFSLEAYDSEKFPKKGVNKKQALFTAKELKIALKQFKQELVVKKQATDLFGKERTKNALEGIVGNVFQSFGGQDLYPTIEEKSAHLLYFMVKNHPFSDGNKRSGAFAFVWFLQKALGLPHSLTSPALTALTLLIAESNPKDKDKMIGLVLLLLQKKQKKKKNNRNLKR